MLNSHFISLTQLYYPFSLNLSHVLNSLSLSLTHTHNFSLTLSLSISPFLFYPLSHCCRRFIFYAQDTYFLISSLTSSTVSLSQFLSYSLSLFQFNPLSHCCRTVIFLYITLSLPYTYYSLSHPQQYLSHKYIAAEQSLVLSHSLSSFLLHSFKLSQNIFYSQHTHKLYNTFTLTQLQKIHLSLHHTLCYFLWNTFTLSLTFSRLLSLHSLSSTTVSRLSLAF